METESPTACSISVAVRLRPSGGSSCWETSGKFVSATSGEAWRFNEVFGPKASTYDLYEKTVEQVINDFCEGATSTIFACGPKASGKSFTMQGDSKQGISGLVQMAATQIWRVLQPKQLQVSYLEVGDTVKDLLTGSDLTRAWQDMTRRSVRAGLEDISTCLREGNKWRSRRGGPRSHTVFLIHMESRSIPCVLSFVDLAAWDGEDRGDSTSRSLMALAAFLRSHSDGGLNSRAVPREPLTQLLRQPLESSANVVIVCAISAGSESVEESRRVLDFFGLAKEDAGELEREDEEQALHASVEQQKELEGRVQTLEMETKELRMAFRMEKESWQTQLNESWQNQLNSLDARLRRAEQRAKEATTAAPAVAVAAPPVVPSRRPESVAAKEQIPKRRRMEHPEPMEADSMGHSPNRHKGEDSALAVASELMRCLSAEERMDALIAATKSSEKRIPKAPASLVSKSQTKVMEAHSPALLALPAKPTSITPRRPRVESQAARAKVVREEAEAQQTRIKQLQQELARRREALSSKAPMEQRSKIAVEGETEGKVPSEAVPEEKMEPCGQAFLIPRSKSRAQKVEQPEVGSQVSAGAPAREAAVKDLEDPWLNMKDRQHRGETSMSSRQHLGNESMEDDQQETADEEVSGSLLRGAGDRLKLQAEPRFLKSHAVQGRSHPSNLARPFRGAAPPRMLRSRRDSENCQQM